MRSVIRNGIGLQPWEREPIPRFVVQLEKLALKVSRFEILQQQATDSVAQHLRESVRTHLLKRCTVNGAEGRDERFNSLDPAKCSSRCIRKSLQIT